MASFCILDEFEVHKNEDFLQIAEELKPELHERTVTPVSILTLEQNGQSDPVVVSKDDPDTLKTRIFKKDDSVILDFGTHYVGYLTLDLASAGSHQDAPAYIHLRFAERLDELTANTEEYDGWISKGWLQE